MRPPERITARPAGRHAAWLLWLLCLASALALGCRRPSHACPHAGRELRAAPERRAIAHAHNDYEHPRPLEDALALGFASVEADVWWQAGDLRVSHLGLWFKGTLRQLYLDPLQARVDRLGSVHGDGQRFTLWIDIKHGDAALARALRKQLDGYAMISRVRNGKRQGGAVDVVLTGNEAIKRAVLAGDDVPATRDSHALDAGDDPLVTHYSLHWSDYLGWDGTGPISDGDRDALRCIVRAAHAQGRHLRFFASPDTPSFWQLAAEMHIDFIGTDRIADMSRYLASRR